MLKLIGNVLMWASLLIAISGIAYYYWIGMQDMLPVYVAAGIMCLLDQVRVMSVPTPTTFALTVLVIEKR